MKFLGLLSSLFILSYGVLVRWHNETRWDGDFEKALEAVTLYGGALSFVLFLVLIIREMLQEHKLNQK